MDTLEKTLVTFTNAREAQEKYIRANMEIFKENERLAGIVMDAEGMLRDAGLAFGEAIAKEELKNEQILVENSRFRIVYYPYADKRFVEANIIEKFKGKDIPLSECILNKPRITISRLASEDFLN